MATIEERVKLIVSEQLGVNLASIKNSDYLHRDLNADSLDAVELVMAIEEEYVDAIPKGIPDEDAEKWETVQQIIDYVTARVPAVA